MSIKAILEAAIERLKQELRVEAVTVFLRDENSQELIFWAMKGGERSDLEGTKMPLSKGIVGWVMEHRRPAAVNDTSKDERFFSLIDRQSSFTTRNLLCVPLSVRGTKVLGAIEALNTIAPHGFVDEDLEFLEQCGNQISLAIDNAQLLEKLSEENAKLEKLNRRKDELITVVAHEIRTPLTIIQGGAEILAASAAKENQEIAEAMVRGVARLSHLAAEIRTVGNLHGKKLTLSMLPIPMSRLADSVTAYFSEAFAERTQRFEIALPEEPLSVLADFALIFVVLKNLVANAIRFTPDGGTITLAAASSNGLVEISVQDTGIGMAAEELTLIFEKFYEVGSSLHHQSGKYAFGSSGLGIGLSSAKTILESHGTSIEVSSMQGTGSVFRFFLPAV